MVGIKCQRSKGVRHWFTQLTPFESDEDWIPLKEGEEKEIPIHAVAKTGWAGKFRVKWNEDLKQPILFLGDKYFPLSLADLDGANLTGDGEISWRFNTRKIYRTGCQAQKKVRFEGLTLPVEELAALAAKVRKTREKR